MVLTRDIPPDPASGRERTLAGIRGALAQRADVRIFCIASFLERPSLGRFARVGWRYLATLCRGRCMAAQELLFCDPAAEARLLALLETLHPQAVYFDSIRTHGLLQAVRARYPSLRLVCDFDDLMSRRFALIRAAGHGISGGYLERHIPRWVSRLVLNGVLGRWVQGYEAATLRRAEREAARAADAVSLVSAAEAELLRGDLDAAARGKVVVIPPCMDMTQRLARPDRVTRFVFIGSDGLLQNYLTVDYLVELWRNLRPALALHLYGRMSRSYPEAANVVFHGAVDSLEEVYSPGSVALCPSFVNGGVKTKVGESIGHGIIPFGNSATFEGYPPGSALLALTAQEFAELVRSPEDVIARADPALENFRLTCREHFSRTRVAGLWLVAFGIAG
jgi:glycosyltransferase involved in cell wall biosynthesis